MPNNSLPFSFRIFALLVLALALAACGSGGHVICNVPCGIGPGAEFVVATSLGGQVLSLPVDLKTGAVGAANSIPGPVMSLGLAAVGSQFVYASDFQNNLIYAYSIDPASGALTAVVGSPFGQGLFSLPSGLVAGRTSNSLYAAVFGGVDAFSINGMGVPAVIAGSPFPAAGLDLAADPTGTFLFASYVDPPNGVFSFTIDSATGALTSVPGSPFPFAGQTVPDSRPYGIVVDSTSHFVYAALSAANQVAAFSIVSGTGALAPVPGSPFTAGNTPFLLATTGKFLYVTNAQDGTISGYTIDATSGVLAPVAGSPFSFPVASLVTDPSGNFLYGAGGAGIFVFSIDATTGALTSIAGSPFPAAQPTLLTIVQMPGQGG